MDWVTLLAQAQAARLTVYAEGDRLVVLGPRSAEPLVQILLAHKAELMPLLVTPAMTVKPPCLICGASDWRNTPEAAAGVNPV